MYCLLRKITKQKNGVCVSTDKYSLDVLILRKERKDFTEGGTANCGKVGGIALNYRFF